MNTPGNVGFWESNLPFCVFFFWTFQHRGENANKLLILILLKVFRAVSSYLKCSRSLRLLSPSFLQNKLEPNQGCLCQNVSEILISSDIHQFASPLVCACLSICMYSLSRGQIRPGLSPRHLSHISSPVAPMWKWSHHTSPAELSISTSEGGEIKKTLAQREREVVLMSLSATSNWP